METQIVKPLTPLEQLRQKELEYHDRPEMSNSGIRVLNRSFDYFKYTKQLKQDKSLASHFEIGTAFDFCMCLQSTDILKYVQAKKPTENMMKLLSVIDKHNDNPVSANQECKAFVDDKTASSKFYAAEVQQYIEEINELKNNPGCIVLTKENYDLVCRLYKEATTSNFYLTYIKGNPSVEYQKIVTWTEFLSNGQPVEFRGMLDIVFEYDDVIHIVDMKTSSESKDLTYSIRKYGYADQLAGYVTGIEKLYPKKRVEAYLFFINTGEPFETTIYNLKQETLRFGKDRTLEILERNSQHFNAEGFIDFESSNTKPLFLEI